MTVLAVFRSRSHSLDFSEKLREYGVPAETVPAPKEARIGCGLCVRFDDKVFPRVKAVLKMGKYSSFKGFYRLDFEAGQQVLKPIR